ncbi:exodeoxyribonuclease III [Spirochaeta cellobiosiphila]|uniref:exodeoxyribonuclease III n=1 Tax=Spirochaeta cellobiosiphila TaxID=504483 RepID=UPI0003FAE2BC|nr:exodeoxyribonuclease III [Spirochaeta cellobiosiphila]
MKSIYTWNVNGIRAAEKKGLFDWMDEIDPDILALQETKAQPEQLTENFLNRQGYHTYWASAVKKGYSGVVAYTKEEPQKVENLGIEEFDSEGRFQALHFTDYILINSYFPNSQEKGKRLDYKLAYLDAVLEYASNIVNSGKNVLICGDYNIAHKPIDLANPKSNVKNPGYLPEERAWMDKFLEAGYVDTFRLFNKEPHQYTWWSYRMNARERNIGWRIDYHCVNQSFSSKVKDCLIYNQVLGSDHCPVRIDLDI